jgi:ammonia channel protein AmtB
MNNDRIRRYNPVLLLLLKQLMRESHIYFLHVSVDDPISCIPLHFGGGLWGAIGTSMLRQDSFVGGYGTQGGYYLAYQIAGTLAIILWGWACMIVLLGGLRLLNLLRVSPEDELRGKKKSLDTVRNLKWSYQRI